MKYSSGLELNPRSTIPDQGCPCIEWKILLFPKSMQPRNKGPKGAVCHVRDRGFVIAMAIIVNIWTGVGKLVHITGSRAIKTSRASIMGS